jgi:hypothetical protein
MDDDYFAELTRHLPIAVKLVEHKGRGVVLQSAVVGGAVVFTEAPLASMQHADNRADVLACGQCCRVLGSVSSQVMRLVRSYCVDADVDADAALDAGDGDIPQLAGVSAVACERGCGTFYCSDACKTAVHTAHHWLLCEGPPLSRADEAAGEVVPQQLFEKQARGVCLCGLCGLSVCVYVCMHVHVHVVHVHVHVVHVHVVHVHVVHATCFQLLTVTLTSTL